MSLKKLEDMKKLWLQLIIPSPKFGQPLEKYPEIELLCRRRPAVLPYTDSHPDATGGFTDTNTQAMQPLEVNIPENLACRIGADTLAALRGTLACDPRPRYQHDPERIYGMTFANREVKFKVDGTTVTVISID